MNNIENTEEIIIDTTQENEITLKDSVDPNKEIESMNLDPTNSFVNVKYTDGSIDLLSQNSEQYLKLTGKIQKKKQIEQIATLTEQLNLMAGVLAEYVEAIPENERSEIQRKALNAYYEIQNILNN